MIHTYHRGILNKKDKQFGRKVQGQKETKDRPLSPLNRILKESDISATIGLTDFGYNKFGYNMIG